MTLKEITTREESWEACLTLWKKLANTKTHAVSIDDFSNLKLNALKELGYQKNIMAGCPFCHLYHNTKHCPIGDCSNNTPCLSAHCPYNDWADGCCIEGKHIQSRAREFYKYLLELKEEE